MRGIPGPMAGARPAPGRFPQADGAGTQGCGRSAPASETSITRGPETASREEGTLRNVGLVVLLVLVNILVMIMVFKFLHSPAE